MLFILRTFCEKQSGSNVDGEGLAPVSVLVHYLLRQLPAVVVSTNALTLSKIVKRSVDVSKPQVSAAFHEVMFVEVQDSEAGLIIVNSMLLEL